MVVCKIMLKKLLDYEPNPTNVEEYDTPCKIFHAIDREIEIKLSRAAAEIYYLLAQVKLLAEIQINGWDVEEVYVEKWEVLKRVVSTLLEEEDG